ncbi:MAG: hypothetical protein BGO67_09180 [Alphaproteobacteria bacterium 41-28]|nr:MAG: hypothetical protein BGO67_09180 [Alphaproteobacteria bacterium 41-28]
MNKLGSHFVKDQLFSFHVLMPLLMLVSLGLVYLPFGFSQVGLIEEWGALGFFTEYGPLYFVTKYSHMAQTRMRPLHMLPQSIGYRLDTDSFFYWHLLQFLFIWLKGVAMGSILWWLYSQRGIAILGALLLMLYPADTMQLAIRSININGAVTSAICAVACLLWATEVKNLWARAILASFAGVLFFCASLLYEAAFFLAPTPLILWWAKYGMHEGWRALKTQKLVLCCWLASILMELGYLYWLSFELDPYTSHLNNTPWNTLKIIFQNSPMLLKVGFYRTFLHSWYDAGRMLLSGGKWVAFLPIAVPSILLLVLYLSAKNADLGKKISRKDPGFLTRWFVASILITALGYAPYLALVTHHRITQRTYLFAAIEEGHCFALRL